MPPYFYCWFYGYSSLHTQQTNAAVVLHLLSAGAFSPINTLFSKGIFTLSQQTLPLLLSFLLVFLAVVTLLFIAYGENLLCGVRHGHGYQQNLRRFARRLPFHTKVFFPFLLIVYIPQACVLREHNIGDLPHHSGTRWRRDGPQQL